MRPPHLPARALRLCAALAAAASLAAPATAQGLAGAGAEGLESVTLLEGWRQPNGTHVAALEIRLRPGWHTYWRAPGAYGIPPQFDWSGSRNLESVSYVWPRPSAFESYGARTIGYHDALVLPMILRPSDPDAPIEAALEVLFGVCEDICIPAEAQLAATLAVEGPPAGKPRIDRALSRRAQTATEAGVLDATCELVPGADGDGHELAATVTFGAAPAPGQIAVLEAGRPEVWVGESHSVADGSRISAQAEMRGASGGVALDRSAVQITIFDETRAVEIRGCRKPG